MINPATTATSISQPKPVLGIRIQSVDFLRGAVMVLMAIDHVRVYSGLPAGGPEPGIFFTRWVTHFCAPGFVFLAGTSAFLYGNKSGNKKELARFLFTRGLFLVLLELTLIRFFWTFNLNFKSFMLAGVIWTLGWCMVFLAALVRLSPKVVGFIGLAIIFFQDLFGMLPGILPVSIRGSFGLFWEFIYSSGLNGWPAVTILYVLVPWIGVMAAGYGFGAILIKETVRRRKICLQIGIAAMLIFIVAGSINIFSRPATQDAPHFMFQLLNQRKYPASQLFLLMTLGPIIALVTFAEKAKGWLSRVLIIFGRVPMFYYLLHILLIHISALLVTLLREGKMYSEWYASAPYTFISPEKAWTLPLLYFVFAIDVLLLYFACRWYAGYKFAHRDSRLLKYI